MRYTIRPGATSCGDDFAVATADAREALDIVRGLIDRGLTDMQIFDAEGKAYDLADFERIVNASEAAHAQGS